MARKRTLHPNIWESEDVAQLNYFERLMLIGMISIADDAGKGKANASFLKSVIFPYDADISTRKVNATLENIAKHCSVELYTVSGKKYYKLKNWAKWQKVDRPTPSLLPNPQKGTENTRRILDEDSTNTRRILDEDSLQERRIRNREEKRTKKEENNNKKKEYLSQNACAYVCDINNIINKFIFNTGIKDAFFEEGIDYTLLEEKVLESDYLKGVSFYWIMQNYEKVIKDAYKNHRKSDSSHFKNERIYTQTDFENLVTDIECIDI